MVRSAARSAPIGLYITGLPGVVQCVIVCLTCMLPLVLVTMSPVTSSFLICSRSCCSRVSRCVFISSTLPSNRCIFFSASSSSSSVVNNSQNTRFTITHIPNYTERQKKLKYQFFRATLTKIQSIKMNHNSLLEAVRHFRSVVLDVGSRVTTAHAHQCCI